MQLIEHYKLLWLADERVNYFWYFIEIKRRSYSFCTNLNYDLETIPCAGFGIWLLSLSTWVFGLGASGALERFRQISSIFSFFVFFILRSSCTFLNLSCNFFIFKISRPFLGWFCGSPLAAEFSQRQLYLLVFYRLLKGQPRELDFSRFPNARSLKVIAT